MGAVGLHDLEPAVGPHGIEVRAAGEHMDLISRGGQCAGEVASDASGADDRYGPAIRSAMGPGASPAVLAELTVGARRRRGRTACVPAAS